jgi:hypothetical protein
LPVAIEKANDQSGTLTTGALMASNVVSTVAGVSNSAGFADGPAKTLIYL